MIFGGTQSREEILNTILKDRDAFDNVIAMANVGAAFVSIYNFEELLAGLILTSKTQIEARLKSSAIFESNLFLERHRQIRSSTLGRLLTALEKSGVGGRDIRYLRVILELRNDFIHRFGEQAPLPGDWERYGYSLEDFSQYTRYVMRHMHSASYFVTKILHRNGLIAAVFGDFGALVSHPDDPIIPGVVGR